MKIIGVIPARYKSSRFPGKPLSDICGKPMIWWVYQQCRKVEEFDEIYVATDDERIKSVCDKEGLGVIMTSEKHLTGTDRVAEVSQKTDGDLYVVVMGDEPLISPDNIRAMISGMFGGYDAGMLCTKFKNGVDLINNSTIKLAVNDRNELIYMSRLPIPFPKAVLGYSHYKNVGVYAFTNKALDFFRSTPRGRLEAIEDMEMLRLLENHKLVKVVEVETESMSVDTQKDLERIREKAAETGFPL
ncbi:MAG: 3-deoxy-manno-octulosonate cytidylyltransferase [Ruminococcus sp.]|nr:3-deoxy-manno-octulosonate cytidylyltransferase [Ruminococcus sp.]